MVSTTPVILILGAGARIGQSVRDAFARRGYKVALTSRTATESDNTSDQISVAGDLSNPESVAGIFAKVKELLGIPSVVVYNGMFTLDRYYDGSSLRLLKPELQLSVTQRILWLSLWKLTFET